MKARKIGLISFIAGILTIASSVLYLAKGIMIPGIGPLSLAIFMLCHIYLNKVRYDKGKIDTRYWRFIFIMLGIAFVGNIIAGISQIQVTL